MNLFTFIMTSFDQRKKSILEKADKASKGSWDEKVIEICNKLNESDDYYTTSSCSGKSVIMDEKLGKDGSYYLWSSHELVGFAELKEAIDGVVGKSESQVVKFKSESPILFICCRDVDSAKKLLEKCVEAGFKESGIKITNKLIAVEVRSGEKIEFPLMYDGEMLVWEEFLRVLVEEVNRKREFGWNKLDKLFQLVL